MRLSKSPYFLPALLLIIICAALGCQNFYLPVASRYANEAEKNQELQKNMDNNRYFILRHGSGNYAISSIELDRQNKLLKGQLRSLPPEHKTYTDFPHKYRYIKRLGQQAVLNEVHLFMPGTNRLDTTRVVTLPLDSIKKIEVIQVDQARTTTSYILGGLGVAVGTFAVVAAIVAATKESCPFVSVYDGKDYVVQGELFGGAIYPSLEREDYVPLRAGAVDGAFQVRIHNELQEKQFTDFADLVVITHDDDVRALTDRSGKVYTICEPVVPVRAMLNNRADVTPALEMTEGWLCLFDDTTSRDHINELVLQFDKAAGQKKGKLVLQLKNSYWFDYLFGEFTSSFGGYYDNWIKKQKKEPASKLHQWTREQHIPLTISLKTADGWKEVEQIKTIGPLANRELLVPLDLQDVKGEEVEVRLSTGFMFWELDYAAIDYSPDRACTVQVLKPFEGTDEKGQDVLPVLMHSDKKYLDQPQVGNAAVLKYKLQQEPAEGQALSVVLHTRGYYEHVRHFKGKPRVAFLRGFEKPGAFAAFSRQKYEQVLSQKHIALNQ